MTNIFFYINSRFNAEGQKQPKQRQKRHHQQLPEVERHHRQRQQQVHRRLRMSSPSMEHLSHLPQTSLKLQWNSLNLHHNHRKLQTSLKLLWNSLNSLHKLFLRQINLKLRSNFPNLHQNHRKTPTSLKSPSSFPNLPLRLHRPFHTLKIHISLLHLRLKSRYQSSIDFRPSQHFAHVHLSFLPNRSEFRVQISRISISTTSFANTSLKFHGPTAALSRSTFCHLF